MKYSKLFGKTIKADPKDEVSTNAKLLIRAGFIRKEVAGVYNYLPLGLRVLNKISNIVRDEMNRADGQEMFMSSLQNKANWEKTGRWNTFDALFKVKSRFETEYGLGPTHEEVLVPLAKQCIASYKDLPFALYQIQTKFRDEERAKSGILRGREFLMKDLYSFHTDEEDFEKYYERMKLAYKNVFERCGLHAIMTEASGGAFSKFSHEYQVLTPAGEDTIFYCEGKNCGFAQNKEIAGVKAGDSCHKCLESGHNETIKEGKTIEVGNIFPLKTRFSKMFDVVYKAKDGTEQLVVMGCYGIGISRLMGAIVEVHHDDKGIVWPKALAPYQVHIVILGNQDEIRKQGEELYKKLQDEHIDVLYDNREDAGTGEKLADVDLIGIPVRLVVSIKNLTQSPGVAGQNIEWKTRNDAKTELLSFSEVMQKLKR